MSSLDGYALRRCAVEDIPALTGFRLKMFREFYTGTIDGEAMYRQERRFFTRAFEDGGAAWFAEAADGVAVASAAVVLYELPPKPWATDGRNAYICSMYTEPEHRRRGLARALFSRCVEYAREIGVTALTLHAAPMGRGLYESFGFLTTNEMRQLPLVAGKPV